MSKSIVGGARVIVVVAATVVLTVAGSAPVWADDDIPPDPAPADDGAVETDDVETDDGAVETDDVQADDGAVETDDVETDDVERADDLEPAAGVSGGGSGTGGTEPGGTADAAGAADGASGDGVGDVAADGGAGDQTGDVPVESAAEQSDGEAMDPPGGQHAIEQSTIEQADGEAMDPPGGQHAIDQSTIEQSTEVTGTAIAVATTGNNVAVGTGAATTTDTTNAVSITTGSSTAAGNHEQTAVTQEAITTLSGAATAEIVQISIVFNIGGAYAGSGGNSASSVGAGGASASTQTGSGVAIGNDSETYVTQAGSATTAGTQTASVTQQTVTLQFGVATASTGGNSIVTTVADGSGGLATITTGGASAVGNESTTSVEQVARAVGSGNAALTIEQWATIINLGVALANTGANQVGDMIAAAWADPDGADAADLFAILLPALLAGDPAVGPAGGQSRQSGAPAGGSGSITTGDALAIGNRSTTEVQQVAVAVASGDSASHVRQEVVVVNAGAAIADTGHNHTGAGLAPATLGAAELAVLDQLTTFVFGLLAEIDAWADGTDSTVESSSLTAQLGDQLIGIGGDLSTSTGQTTTASGVLANIRQLTAVINLGLAIADSGSNVAFISEQHVADQPPGEVTETSTSSGDPSGRTVSRLSTGQVAIVTGDAIAENRAVIVVCQRANLSDHPCLAPEEPAETGDDAADDTDLGSPIELDLPPSSAMVSATDIARPGTVRSSAEQRSPTPVGVQFRAADARGSRSLPATGGDPIDLVLLALGALLTGGTLVAVSRQRRS